MSVRARLLFSVLSPIVLRRFRAVCAKPRETQEELLQHILEKNQHTVFGKKHRFAEIFTFDEYQAAVPTAEYDDLEPYIRRAMEGSEAELTAEKPFLYGTTSGTTGAEKYIPATPESRDGKAALMRVWLSGIFRDHPGIFKHKVLAIVSPEVDSHAPDGTPCGAESGHGYKNIPAVIRSTYSCPYEVYEIKDYHAKYYVLVRIAAEQSLSFIYCCNPSTLLILGESLEEHTERIIKDVRNGTLDESFNLEPSKRKLIERTLKPNPARADELERLVANASGALRPKHIWPELAAIACWKGGTVKSYLKRLPRYYDRETPIRDIGYLATEVRGTVPLSDVGDAGVCAVQTNVYEFLPVDTDGDPVGDKLLKIDEVEAGGRYMPYITTTSGLYRYNMNDLVEVTGFFEKTPILRFLHKAKGIVSFTGEKLSEAQAIAASEAAVGACRLDADFVTAVGEDDHERPRYSFLFEFEEAPPEAELQCFADAVDASLCEANVEYASKRKSLRLGPPRVCALPRGAFHRYRRAEVERGRGDGQFKILRITDNRSVLEKFSWEKEAVASDNPDRISAAGG